MIPYLITNSKFIPENNKGNLSPDMERKIGMPFTGSEKCLY